MSDNQVLPLAPALLAAGLLAFTAPSHAAHPLVTDDTGTQGTGRWQFELNTDHARARDDDDSTAWARDVNATLTRGLTDTLDLAVNLPWVQFGATGESSVSGVSDLALLAKWRFYDNGQGWTLGVRPLVTFPTGDEDKGLGNGRADGSLTLISSVESGPWTWLANAGYAYNDNKAGDRRHLWVVTTAMLFRPNAQWTLAADIGAIRAAEVGEGTEKFGLIGIIYHIGEDIDLDVGWRRARGIGPSANILGAGVTLRW